MRSRSQWLCCVNNVGLLNLFFSFFYRSDIDTRRAMESLVDHMTSQAQTSVSCSCAFPQQYLKYAFLWCRLQKKYECILNLKTSHWRQWNLLYKTICKYVSWIEIDKWPLLSDITSAMSNFSKYFNTVSRHIAAHCTITMINRLIQMAAHMFNIFYLVMSVAMKR